MIYLDEFHISTKPSSFYNWSKKGSASILALNHDPWTMSFIVAFSNIKVEGILASDHSINDSMFISFIRAILLRIEDEQGDSLDI